MISYRQAGVSIDENARWVQAIQAVMRSTYGPRVFERRGGGFAGLFRFDFAEPLLRRHYARPLLAACADGVGTKVLLALQLGDLSGIGIDLVAMNVNDLIAVGAEPLFFLDYLAVHKLDSSQLLTVMESIAAGCREAGCALLGGETAEMPDLYHKGHIDLAGFAVGVVEQSRVVDGTRIMPGDRLIGLPSSGVHANGYTLVRKLIANEPSFRRFCEKLGATPAKTLLCPTRIYARAWRAIQKVYRKKRVVSGMAHVTGGGLRENLERILPERCDARIRRRAWRPPPIFAYLRGLGVSQAEMWKVFNMGIGFVLVVRPPFAAGIRRALARVREPSVEIGEIVRGSGRVRWE